MLFELNILSKNSICLWPIHIDIHVLKLNPKEIKEHLKRINQLPLNDSRKRNLLKREVLDLNISSMDLITSKSKKKRYEFVRAM